MKRSLIIVDGLGHTLHLFEKDTRTHGTHAGACAVYGPPLLTRRKSVARQGAKPSLLATIRRAEGTRQGTYAGDALAPVGKKIEQGVACWAPSSTPRARTRARWRSGCGRGMSTPSPSSEARVRGLLRGKGSPGRHRRSLARACARDIEVDDGFSFVRLAS
jgi:hypothetical protein